MSIGQGPYWGGGAEPKRQAPGGGPQTPPTGQDLRSVARPRAKLWAAGFRPVAVWGVGADRKRGKTEQLGKHPFGDVWQDRARQNPPADACTAPDPRALNTGILGDGLRALDLDIDDETIANDCLQIAAEMFPDAPVRFRSNSSRRLVLLRAAAGEPSKITLAGARHTIEHACKVEILGKGQMFVAFGEHESGAVVQWTEAPGDCRLAELPSATEDDIQRFLARCAPIIGARPTLQGDGGDHQSGEPQAEFLRLVAALNNILNNWPADWEWWNKVGMAMFAATGGSNGGFEAYDAWSARNPSYNAEHTKERWRNYRRSPPTEIGRHALPLSERGADKGAAKRGTAARLARASPTARPGRTPVTARQSTSRS